MRRPILLLACCAGLVAVLIALLRSPDRAGDVSQVPQEGAGASSPSADLSPVEIASLQGGQRAQVATTCDLWRVLVQDTDGEPVPAARLEARLDGKLMEATGSAAWTGVVPGQWDLIVRSDAHTQWRRPVRVDSGPEKRTVVTLGASFVVRGVVRDSEGAPCQHRLVGFVRQGSPFPERPRAWLAQPHGRTDGGGAFEATLPEEGPYEVFVGFGGRIVLHEPVATALTPDGPSRVSIVVPASTRLVVRVEEEDGSPPRHDYGVSIFRTNESLDRERPIPPTPPTQPLPDPDDPALDDDARAEAIAEIEAAKRVLTPADLANIARRQSVKHEGWRTDRSAMLGESAELFLERMPAGEELRFAVARGREPFRVEGGAWLVEGRSNSVVIALPPEDPDADELDTSVRTVQLRVVPMTPQVDRLDVGVVWSR